MADIQNNIISNLIFKANLDALKESQKMMQAVGKEGKEIAKRLSMEGKANIDTQNLQIAEDLMRRTGLEANSLQIGLKRLGMTIKGGKIIGQFNQEIKATEINMKKLRAASVQFKMSLLSVMFAGMALQRATGKMLRSFVTTFQKANEDTEGLGKATWHLQAAWEFLKYSMMDALLQSDLFKLLVQYALQLIMWFNKLPASAKAFIMIGLAILFILGGLMMVIGQIGLFINGMAALGIGQGLIVALGAAFWWLALIVGIVIALWVTDLGNFRDFFKQTFGILWQIVKLIFGHMWSVISDTLKLIKAIFKGDFDEVYRIIVNMWKKALAFQLKIFYALGAAIKNLGTWMINVLVDVAQFGVNALIAAVNALIRALNRVPGIKIPQIPALDLSGYKKAYTTLADVKDQFESINKSIGIDKILAEAPTLSSDMTTQPTSKVDNSTKNFELNFTMPEGVTDIDSLSDKVLEKINDSYSRSNDSTL